MPPMPAKAAPPADMTDDTDTDTAAAPGADDVGGDDQSGQVLCTVLKNPDGGYTLLAGDEEDASAGPAEGDMSGGDIAPAKPEGQTFSEPGQLLKGILDLLNKDAEASGGTAQSHFEGGFNDDAPPTPKKPPPKY
jgi:hypothetical protein